MLFSEGYDPPTDSLEGSCSTNELTDRLETCSTMKFQRLLTARMLHASRDSPCPVFLPLLGTDPTRRPDAACFVDAALPCRVALTSLLLHNGLVR